MIALQYGLCYTITSDMANWLTDHGCSTHMNSADNTPQEVSLTTE